MEAAVAGVEELEAVDGARESRLLVAVNCRLFSGMLRGGDWLNLCSTVFCSLFLVVVVDGILATKIRSKKKQ